jgi:hypothetical protein
LGKLDELAVNLSIDVERLAGTSGSAPDSPTSALGGFGFTYCYGTPVFPTLNIFNMGFDNCL